MANFNPIEHIKFHYLLNNFSFNNRNKLKLFISDLITKEGRSIEYINYIFCSDDYLLEINKQYLKHHTLTDIITFDLSSKKDPIQSDIYISIDRVKDNSANFNTSFEKELHRVIFHGALHLVGYKDKGEKEEKKMREMEELYLNKYFVPRGTAKGTN